MVWLLQKSGLVLQCMKLEGALVLNYWRIRDRIGETVVVTTTASTSSSTILKAVYLLGKEWLRRCRALELGLLLYK